jgi:superfamily II DNA or RNA helicase
MSSLFSGTNPSLPPGTILRCERYSHHLRLSGYQQSVLSILMAFCKTLGEVGFVKRGRKWVKEIVRVFAGSTRTRSEINIHRNDETRLMRYLENQGIKPAQIHIIDHPMYTPQSVAFRYIDQRTARDYQAPIIEYICAPGKTKVVTLDPGRGKTFITLAAMARLGVRTMLLIKAGYIDQWVASLNEAFEFEVDALCVVRGQKALQNLMRLAQNDQLTASVIVCSNSTYQQYLKQYERFGHQLVEVGYPFNPHAFFEQLRIGLRVVDELHETFHFNFRLDCYTHVPKTLGLTGTLFSDKPFIERMQVLAYPPHERYLEPEPDVHIAVYGLKYRIDNVNQRLRYINKTLKTYSHIRFEQSILKNQGLLSQYLAMISDIVYKRYARSREEGQRMVIYFSTVAFCNEATAYLSAQHPALSVKRYVSEDEYEGLFDHDVLVSTLKSLGTAMDIPGLRVILMTDALSSVQANVQAAGRLRRLKDWPDVTPEFLFLICEDIERHLHYAKKKYDDFKGRVKRFEFIDTGYRF